MTLSVHKSTIDASVNFVSQTDDGGMLESRYVHRPGKSYITCYLSTQTGCGMGCRFCHLTTTKQTKARDATGEEILVQAGHVLGHHDEKAREWVKDVMAPYEPEAVHFSFMARGEPLASEEFWNRGDWIMRGLEAAAVSRGLMPRFMVSTIMPKWTKERLLPFGGQLAQVFRVYQPHIYYSIYSTDQKFREKWLPGATTVNTALEILKDYQDQTGRIIKLHWSLIEGENDSLENAKGICDAVDAWKLRVDVNLVRYNPWSEAQGREASADAYRLTETLLRIRWPMSRIKTVDRVGEDVFAVVGCSLEERNRSASAICMTTAMRPMQQSQTRW